MNAHARNGRVLAVAANWFSVEQISPTLTLVREPHVKPLLAANTWMIHGRDGDLVIDSGLGVAPLHAGVPQMFERTPTLVVTHGHLDHLGGAHEFEEIWAHRNERIQRPGRGTLLPQQLRKILGGTEGTFGNDILIDAVPDAGYDPQTYDLQPVTPTREIGEGDIIDLGDLQFQVLHLPGHTPGSIGLYEPDLKMLVSGDVAYDDDDMIDYLDESSPRDYQATMRRLLELDIDTVVPGHGDCFGQDRLAQIVDHYLRAHRHRHVRESAGIARRDTV